MACVQLLDQVKILPFQNTDHRSVARIRDDTFAGMDLGRFVWQPCQQVESLKRACLKYVWTDDAVKGYVAAYSMDETHFRLNLIVDPACRNQRIGTLLLECIEAELRRLGATHLQARLLENMEASSAFAVRRGFGRVHSMRGMSLCGGDFSFQHWEECGKRLASKGFYPTTLKEELDANNNNPITMLARLHRSTQQGWPSPDPTQSNDSPIESLELLFTNIKYPESFTIVKLNDEYVGYTSARNKSTATAVHPDYRGIGIATYMKALDLTRSIEQGEEYFESASANPAMQRVNEKLGYRFNGLSEARFVKCLE